MGRRIVVALGLMGLVVAASTTAAWAGGPRGATRVTVCHEAGNGTVVPLTVSENAVAGHLGHRDPLPGDEVMAMDGSRLVYDDACSLVPAAQSAPVDGDGDGVPDVLDNCPEVANATQTDRYGSTRGDACEVDSDGDGVLDVDETDLCVSIDGEATISVGTARCVSVGSEDGMPANIAIAYDGGFAAAAGPYGTLAIAGNGGYAYAAGEDETACADEANETALMTDLCDTEL